MLETLLFLAFCDLLIGYPTMQKLTRRSIASFGVAALLVLAPITATAAYADDDVVAVEAPVEVVAEAPVEASTEEAPVEDIVAAAETPPAEQAPADESAPVTVRAAARAAAVVSPSIRVTYTEGLPLTLTAVDNVLTASWTPPAVNSSCQYLYDVSTDQLVVYECTSYPSLTATLIPGHAYYVQLYDLDYAYAEFTFDPVPAPNSPTNVTATRVTSANSLRLSWAAPTANTANPATSYSIDVTSGGTTSTVTTSQLGYDFTELIVGTTYSFAVTAVADDGQSSGASSTTGTVDAIAPTPATNVSIARSGGQLTASWGAPSYNGGAALNGYTIALRADGALVETYTATTAGSLVLDEPAGYETSYTIDVAAINEAGLTSTVTTSNSVVRPSVTPTTPVVTAERLTTSSAYAVTWTESTAGDAPITGYTVRLYNTADDSVISSVTVSPTTRSATLAIPSTITWGDGLRFDVDATAENGLSSATGSDYAGFAGVAPSAVRNLLLTRDGDDLVANWDAPAYDGGIGIMWYYVDLYADGVLASESRTFDGATSLVFPGAAGYSVEYTVTVVPLGDGGIYGPVTESNAVERANFAPTTPTSFGTAYGYKEPLIYASWDFAPQEGSAVESVTLTLYNADGSIAQQERLSTLAGYTGWNFRNLANDTTYSVGVVATNAAGSSTESARTEVRTMPLAPPAATEDEVRAVPNYNNVTAVLSGSQLTAHIDGASPGEWVFGYAYSSPTALGWTQVDANGFASWSISGAGLATGTAHTLAIQNNFGAQLGFAAFAVPADVTAAALAVTGTEVTGWMVFSAVLLALGAVLMVRRRARA